MLPSNPALLVWMLVAYNHIVTSTIVRQGKSKYDEWKFHYTSNIPEVLEEFQSVKIQASLLLSQLHLLQCRYYSISSSASMHADQVHLTVSVVNYNTQGNIGITLYDTCIPMIDPLPFF